jgi:hypothetical protein
MLIGQLGEKYCDYFAFNIVDCSVNCGLSHSGACRRALAQTIGNARELDIISPLSVETHIQDLDFVDISNTAIPTALGGSTITLSPIVVVILRQQLTTSTSLTTTAPTMPHPIKAKFSSTKSRLFFTFAAPDTRGLRHENHLAYH